MSQEKRAQGDFIMRGDVDRMIATSCEIKRSHKGKSDETIGNVLDLNGAERDMLCSTSWNR